MANIYKRGHIWWARAQRGGQVVRTSLQTRSESIARERLRRWLDELDAQAWGQRPKLTLNQAADEFIRQHGPTLRPTSLRRYGLSIQWLDENMGGLLLTAIGTSELRDFETWRRSMGVSAPTVRRDLACLSSIYGFAAENEWVDSNPVSAFLRARKKRGLRESPPRTRYLTREEEAALLAHATPTVRDAILLAIYSGLRSEEQFGLTWDRVDLSRRQVVIPKEIAKGKRDRIVLLLPPAVEALHRRPRHIRSPYVLYHGRGNRGGVHRANITDRDGDRFNSLLRGLKRAAERAGIKDLIWHDLRRTHGCRLIQDHNFTLAMVRDQLGHSSVVQTERAYAFLEVDSRRERLCGTISGTAQTAGSASPDAKEEHSAPAQKRAHKAAD